MTSESQRRACEFQLLRFVPDAVRNEYVHIGVILREPATAESPGQVEVRFTRDWRRVRCLEPDADTALLEGMESELRRQRLQADGVDAGARVGAEADRAEGRNKLMRLLDESLSLSVADDGTQGLSGRERSGWS